MEKMTTVKLPDGRALEFPVLTGAMGPEVIDDVQLAVDRKPGSYVNMPDLE